MANLQNPELDAHRVRPAALARSRRAPVDWEIARVPAQIDAAQRVRHLSLVGENGIPVADQRFPRDVSRVDLLTTTGHVLVRHLDEPIGTLRLAKPNAEVAIATGTRLGLEDEDCFDLAALLPFRHELGEVARVALLRRHQKGIAFSKLIAGLLALAGEMRVRWLLGTIDCQTSRRDEGELMYQVAEHRGLIHGTVTVQPWSTDDAAEELEQERGAVGFYTPEQRSRGRSGKLDELPLSKPLEVFTRTMGAKLIGFPAPHRHFKGRLVMPVLADLRELPALTRRLSDASPKPSRVPARVARGKPR